MKKFEPDCNLGIHIAEGDENAFLIIYNELYDGIYVFILHYVYSPTLAQDLTQDVFLKIWEKRETFGEVNNLKAYIYKIARNLTLDFLKRVNKSKEIFSEINFHFQTSVEVVEEQFQEKEYFEFIKSELENLPLRSQEIFQLCRNEKKSYKEVAGLLGISRETVKHHMVQTMRTMKESAESRFGIAKTTSLLLFMYTYFPWSHIYKAFLQYI